MLSRGVVSFCAACAGIAARTSRSAVESAVALDCGVELLGTPEEHRQSSHGAEEAVRQLTLGIDGSVRRGRRPRAGARRVARAIPRRRSA